jgi:hypothetical protein
MLAGQPKPAYVAGMVAAAFVAPYLLDATTRFAEAAARLPEVELGLVTTEPADRLRGQGIGHVRAVHGLGGMPPEVSSLVVESRLPEPGQPSSGSYEGDGYVIVRHRDTAVVVGALRRLVTGVRVELG